MSPARFTPSARRVTALLTVAAALALRPAPADAGGVRPAARKQVDQRNRELDGKVNRLTVSSWKRLGGKKARTTRVVGHDSMSVIFRQPSRGLGKGLRSNRVFQLLTTQLGEPHMVPAAIKYRVPRAVGEFAAGEEIMVMADESTFRSADEAPREWLARVPESRRVVAAAVDLLTQYRDRKLANVLINDVGEIRLIDPDSTFVSRSNKPAYRSQFYSGMELGYRSPQSSFGDLPHPVQELVDHLSRSRLEDIQDAYGVDQEEAGVLQGRARDIREHGLTAAVDRYVSTLNLKPAH